MKKIVSMTSAAAVTLLMGGAAFAATTTTPDALVIGHGGKHDRLIEHVTKASKPVAKDITVADGGKLIVFTAPGLPKVAETVTVDKGGLLVVHHAAVKDVADSVKVDGGVVKVDDKAAKLETANSTEKPANLDDKAVTNGKTDAVEPVVEQKDAEPASSKEAPTPVKVN